MQNANSSKGIGQPVRRKEDQRFITGRGRYTSNLHLAGQTHAVFLRSSHAHARIRRLDTTAAAAMPGVVAVLTGKDMADENVGLLPVEFIPRHPNGQPITVPDRRAIAENKVRYVGEPIALVIAETRYQAEDAAEAIVLEYEELAAVTELVEAMRDGAPQLWDFAPNNVACEIRYGDADAVNRAFEVAAHRVSLPLVNNRVAINPMEPRATLATYDPVERSYTLNASHQTPFPLRTHIAASLGISEQHVRVISNDVGGGFGVKGPTYPEDVALLWAAGRIQRPVAWVCSRSEMFLSDTQARGHQTTIEMALDASGRCLAVRVKDLAHLGSYISSYGAGPPFLAQMSLLGGAYQIPCISGHVRLVYTNTVPLDAYRGPGRSECAFMLERVIDVAARQLNIDPAEFRRRNMVTADLMPWTSPTGRVYDCGDFPGVFDRALGLADYEGFGRRREAARKNGKLRGIGISYYIDQTGIGPSSRILSLGTTIPSYESAHVRFNKDGGVRVVTGTHTHGQGLETALAQIVSGRLGVPIEDVEVVHGDTRDIGYGRGTIGARSLLAGGAALNVALQKIVDKGCRIAAHMLESDAGDIECVNGHFVVAGTDRSVSVRDVAREAYFPVNYPIGELEPGWEETGYWDPISVAFPNGCHVCEVEIDPQTGSLQIVDYTSIDDFGNIVNPMLVAGQVHGGIAQGVGQSLLESCQYEPQSGQILTGSLMDYALPRASTLPMIRHETFRGHPCTTNPLGVKGCGEAGAIGAPPALINAAVDALSEFGVVHIEMPASAERIWRIINGQ